MTSHRKAITTILLAAALDIVAAVGFSLVEHIGVWSAFYWSVTTATTVGYGDITPQTITGHVLAVGVMLTVIPLFAATFSLLTSTLTANHVSVHAHRLERRLDHLIKHHPDIPPLEADENEAP